MFHLAGLQPPIRQRLTLCSAQVRQRNLGAAATQHGMPRCLAGHSAIQLPVCPFGIPSGSPRAIDGKWPANRTDWRGTEPPACGRVPGADVAFAVGIDRAFIAFGLAGHRGEAATGVGLVVAADADLTVLVTGAIGRRANANFWSAQTNAAGTTLRIVLAARCAGTARNEAAGLARTGRAVEVALAAAFPTRVGIGTQEVRVLLIDRAGFDLTPADHAIGTSVHTGVLPLHDQRHRVQTRIRQLWTDADVFLNNLGRDVRTHRHIRGRTAVCSCRGIGGSYRISPSDRVGQTGGIGRSGRVRSCSNVRCLVGIFHGGVRRIGADGIGAGSRG